MRDTLKTNYLDKEAVLIIIGLGLIFGMGTMFSYGLRLDLFLCGCFFGAFLGFAGLPMFDKKKWHPKPWICAGLAALGAMTFALSRDYTPQHIFALLTSGLITGYFAPYWAKYM